LRDAEVPLLRVLRREVRDGCAEELDLLLELLGSHLRLGEGDFRVGVAPGVVLEVLQAPA